jgi:hypothetical protein
MYVYRCVDVDPGKNGNFSCTGGRAMPTGGGKNVVGKKLYRDISCLKILPPVGRGGLLMPVVPFTGACSLAMLHTLPVLKSLTLTLVQIIANPCTSTFK